jgi:hypothetical protein
MSEIEELQSKLNHIDMSIEQDKQCMNELKGAQQIELKAYLAMPGEQVEDVYFCSKEALYELAIAQHQLELAVKNILSEKEIIKEKNLIKLRGLERKTN